MKRIRVVPVALFTACLSVVGCNGSTPPAPLAQDLAAQLQADTGVAWTVDAAPNGGAPRILAPEHAIRLAPGSGEQQTRAFVERYASQLHASSESELKLDRRDINESGLEHLRFQQVLPGTDVPVFDAVTVASFDSAGNAHLILPNFHDEVTKVDPTPSATEDSALSAVAADWSPRCGVQGEGVVMTKPRLGVLAPDGETPRLVYRVSIGSESSSCGTETVDIDARTGGVAARHVGSAGATDTAGGVRFAAGLDPGDMKTFSVTELPLPAPLPSSAYTMISVSRPTVTASTYDTMGVPIMTREKGNWDDGNGSAVDAVFHAQKAFEFFQSAFGRNGLDGWGQGVTLIVHDNSKLNGFGKNACYTGGIPRYVSALSGLFLTPRIIIGDGGGNMLPFSASYDVIVHELAHGIVRYTSGFIYENESGALDESFADVMGASAEQGSHLRGSTQNFLIGEALHKAAVAFRDLEHPRRYNQPDHTSGERFCAPGEAPSTKHNDSCYVHSNSGIPNRAFSLMVAGGKHESSVFSVRSPIGWVTARKLWYDTFRVLGPRATFRQAAYAQLIEARRLGKGTEVTCAWLAVGVLQENEVIGARTLCTEVLELEKPQRPTEGCGGIDDGYACNEGARYAAYVCKHGSIAGGIVCPDARMTCRRASANDPRASVDASGRLVCE